MNVYLNYLINNNLINNHFILQLTHVTFKIFTLIYTLLLSIELKSKVKKLKLSSETVCLLMKLMNMKY